jgi:hypothetical protein
VILIDVETFNQGTPMPAGTNLEKDLERLKQVENLRRLRQLPTMAEMLTVELVEKTRSHTFHIDCALIPDSAIEKCLTKTTIELVPEHMVPGATRFHNADGMEVTYFRFGNDDGFEPLVLCRNFHDLRPAHYEISEEFRLFHNLFHSRKTDEYFKIDEAGKGRTS